MKGLVFSESRLRALPKDIKGKISALIPLPGNVFFMRGDGNDCRSISLFFVHIILLPSNFENDLENPNKQAILLHELSHGRFADYLSVTWVWIIILLCGVTLIQFIWKFDGGQAYNVIDRHQTFGPVLLVTLILLLLCALNMVGMLHRREINADFGAYCINPLFLVNFLQNQIQKARFFKFDKWQFESAIKNWMFHPSYQYRLSVILGYKDVSSLQILLPAILLGFCPIYTVAAVAFSLANTALLSFSIVSILSLLLSIICLYQLGDILNKIFAPNPNINFNDRLSFWIGLLIGYEILIGALLYSSNIDNGGDLVILASNNELVTLKLYTVLSAILLGHIHFAIYLKLCMLFFKKTLLGIFATPLFSAIFLSIFGAIKMTGSINVKNDLVALSIYLLPSFISMLLMELILLKLVQILARLYHSKK